MEKFITTTPQAGDADQLIDMHNQSWLDTYPSDEHGVSLEFVKGVVEERRSPEKREKRYKTIEGYAETDSYRFLRIAKNEDDNVIGFIDAFRGEEGGIEMGGLYVDKKYHGKGVAQSLWQEFLDWSGGADITLEVVDYNTRAIRFYEKIGFEKVPGSESLYRDKMTVVKMLRKGDA